MLTVLLQGTHKHSEKLTIPGGQELKERVFVHLFSKALWVEASSLVLRGLELLRGSLAQPHLERPHHSGAATK